MSRKNFEKIAIANRGEVAVRIIRACQELGIETVLLHSEADSGTFAYRLADEKICIGPAQTSESYLNVKANIEGALSAGADAVHPGFGFLSENAQFARECSDKGLVFIGPEAESIELFGDKISAKKMAIAAGAPVIPGYEGQDRSLAVLLKKADEIGYPLIVKAAGGGGGRGLKVAKNKSEVQTAIESAQREAGSSFGSSDVFLEKYLDQAKHIEFQVFGDASGKIYHLGERECSIQRRHQKIIEEALSPSLDEDLRQQMGDTAKLIARKANYKGAGTVEFLLQDGRYYFMEMNTRLQVEHPVTELVMGVDLVKAQILTAMGQSLNWQDDLVSHGHAIECRIYAEDPFQGGIPSTGRLGGISWPYGPGRRFEVGIESGDEVTPFYDSMLAKVIVWDETRLQAIKKMRRTLQDTVLFGVQTNIPLLLQILSHHEFIKGTMTTCFMESYFPNLLDKDELTTREKRIGDLLAGVLAESKEDSANHPSPWAHRWSQS